MRILAAVSIVCATAMFAADEKHEAHARLLDLLGKEFRFDPSATGDEEDGHGSDEDVVILPRFDVHPMPEGIEEAVDKAHHAAELEKFSWKHGGTILNVKGRMKIQFKYNPDHNGIDLLSFSW